jgi:hypothetical protein
LIGLYSSLITKDIMLIARDVAKILNTYGRAMDTYIFRTWTFETACSVEFVVSRTVIMISGTMVTTVYGRNCSMIGRGSVLQA